MTSRKGGGIIESKALTQFQRLIRAVREFLRKRKEARISTLRAAVREAEDFLKGEGHNE